MDIQALRNINETILDSNVRKMAKHLEKYGVKLIKKEIDKAYKAMDFEPTKNYLKGMAIQYSKEELLYMLGLAEDVINIKETKKSKSK